MTVIFWRTFWYVCVVIPQWVLLLLWWLIHCLKKNHPSHSVKFMHIQMLISCMFHLQWGWNSWILSHDRSWIKSIYNKLDIIIYVIVSQSTGHCDVISNQLWCHKKNVNLVRHRLDLWKSSFLLSFTDSLCHVRNKIKYVLSWWTVYELTRVLFSCLYPSLLHNSENKHQNNPLMSAETIRCLSTYIILYILYQYY